MSQPIVMFVDDSETALASTKIATQTLPIDVKQFISATDALAEINDGLTPNLIITDLNMPVMNGLEFLAEVRKLPQTQKVPALMLTTEKKDELKAQGKALGLTGWIVKPFNPTQLKSAINRVLRLG